MIICDKCGRREKGVGLFVMHLNDKHQMSFEEIAGVIENKNINIQIKELENKEEVDHSISEEEVVDFFYREQDRGFFGVSAKSEYWTKIEVKDNQTWLVTYDKYNTEVERAMVGKKLKGNHWMDGYSITDTDTGSSQT